MACLLNANDRLQQLIRIVRHCEARRMSGESKFQNLPGAVFEQLLNEWGSSFVRRVYTRAALGRVLAFGDDDASSSMLIKQEQVDNVTPAPVVTTPPDATKLAVAHGIQMALSSSSREDGFDLLACVDKATTDVASWTRDDRQTYWRYVTEDSPTLVEQL